MSSEGGKNVNASGEFSNTGTTYRTRQLSLLAFLAVDAPDFRLGTRVRHPFEKRPESRIKIRTEKNRVCRPSPKLRKPPSPTSDHLATTLPTAVLNKVLNKVKCPLQSQHSGLDYTVLFHYFKLSKGLSLCKMTQASPNVTLLCCHILVQDVRCF